jgi:hypothetical protein
MGKEKELKPQYAVMKAKTFVRSNLPPEREKEVKKIDQTRNQARDGRLFQRSETTSAVSSIDDQRRRTTPYMYGA